MPDLVLESNARYSSGTSIPKAYEYAWNDEFVAANGFAEALKNGLSSISAKLNTKTAGRAVVVYNPVCREREDVFSLNWICGLPQSVGVFDKNRQEVPSQIVEQAENN